MKRHYRANVAFDGTAKWYQFDTIKPVAAHSDDRKRKMRVYAGISMTGKMLCRRDHAVGLETTDEGGTQTRRHVRIFTERAGVDDRVRRVVVDVQHRSVGDVNPECPSLHGRQPALLPCQDCITRCADCHLGRKHHCATQIDGVWQEKASTGPETRPGLEI